MVFPGRKLEELAKELGFTVVGVLSREETEKALSNELPRLEKWQASGFAAEMSYMERPSEIFAKLEGFHPETKSVICLSASYLESDPREVELPLGFGRVARYAWGKDYHRQLKKRTKKLVQEIEHELGKEVKWRAFSDAVPLLERVLGRASFNGFIGKNTMLIQPGIGSYTFLAEILIDLEIEDVQRDESDYSCKTCTSCLSACPTEAFVSPFNLDARKCISYLTIEKKTGFSKWEEEAISDWVFGCDICQEVCPFNHEDVERSKIEEFLKSEGAGPFLDLKESLSIRSADGFLKRFAGTPLMRAGREQILRNSAAVIANTQFLDGIDALIASSKEDPSEMVRAQALSSLKRLEEISDGIDRIRLQSALGAG